MESATLTCREQPAPGFWYLGFRAPAIAQRTRSAHFVAIDVPGEFTVRLPLGVWTVEGDTFSLLFREWGRRTKRLAGLALGDAVSVIGPLGNSFAIPAGAKRATIVAGGVGVVPFWLLARELRSAGVECRVLLGARTSAHIVGTSALEHTGAHVTLCTDDGTLGARGTVMDALRASPRADVLYGCGPRPMLRALCEHALAADIPCQVSMEETFGCSLGTCWGCVVPVRRGCPQGTGYPRTAHEQRDYDLARVCADGTVFSASDLRWTA